MKKIIPLILILTFISCEKADENAEILGYNSGIIGTWVESDMDAKNTEAHLMQRSQELAQERYGFIFESDGTFKERKNAGWCGTPPISYDNFDGQWVAKSDSILDITVGYWGGTMTYEMHIVSLEGDLLEVRYLYDSE